MVTDDLLTTTSHTSQDTINPGLKSEVKTGKTRKIHRKEHIDPGNDNHGTDSKEGKDMFSKDQQNSIHISNGDVLLTSDKQFQHNLDTPLEFGGLLGINGDIDYDLYNKDVFDVTPGSPLIDNEQLYPLNEFGGMMINGPNHLDPLIYADRLNIEDSYVTDPIVVNNLDHDNQHTAFRSSELSDTSKNILSLSHQRSILDYLRTTKITTQQSTSTKPAKMSSPSQQPSVIQARNNSGLETTRTSNAYKSPLHGGILLSGNNIDIHYGDALRSISNKVRFIQKDLTYVYGEDQEGIQQISPVNHNSRYVTKRKNNNNV